MKYILRHRKDFWNVPCNPITGYRMGDINTNPNVNIKEWFFNKNINFVWK